MTFLASLKKPAIGFLVIFCILFVGAEVLLRKTVTSFRSVEKGGWLEATPEFLIQYTGNGRRLVPNVSVVIKNHYLSDLDVLINTNDQGFRAEPVPPKKAKNELRVLALGDSITIGDYLPLELNSTHVLQENLQSLLPDNTVRTINAGVMDIGLREELMILKEQGLSTQPDVVLLNFYLNDSRPSWGFTSETRHRGWIRRHSLVVELIYNQLKLLQWIKEQGTDRFAWITSKETLNWQSSREDFTQLVTDATYDWGSAWLDSSWSDLSPYFAELQRLSEAHNFKVVLAAFPVSFQVYSNVGDAIPQQKLAAIAATHGFAFVDLLPPPQSRR